MPERPESNRRDFLNGRSALDALHSQVDRFDLDLPIGMDTARSLDRQSNYLEQYSKNAMACEFELFFNMHQYPTSGAAAMEAFQLIDEIEDQMTIYRDHSEVSQINSTAFENNVVVEQELFDLLQLAREIHLQTGRAFDITSSPLTKVWGFDQRQGELPEPSIIDNALKSIGTEFIQFDVDQRSIRFQTPGIAINLGGIGKGHALDRVARLFEQRSLADFVIHGGQSSVLARGTSEIDSSGSPDDENFKNRGWTVGLSHPTIPGVRLAECYLVNQALGTSGTGRQGFFHQGKRYGHIIDPRTGWPTTHFLSTTVISNSAALSDALATAFFVMTLDEVAQYCESNPDVSAILIEANSKSKGQIDLHSFNLTEHNWRRV